MVIGWLVYSPKLLYSSIHHDNCWAVLFDVDLFLHRHFGLVLPNAWSIASVHSGSTTKSAFLWKTHLMGATIIAPGLSSVLATRNALALPFAVFSSVSWVVVALG